MAPRTLRSLAHHLGLSRTTVSEALRGVSRVSPATIARVRAAASAAGYHRNPLVGHVMSQLRSETISRFRGSVALLEINEGHRPPGANAFDTQLVQGATQRANELGFAINRLVLGPEDLPPKRLNAVMDARSIGGVMILPAFNEVRLEALDWPKYSWLYFDRVIHHPRMHSVSPDHYGGMIEAMHQLVGRGYRRPGLVLRKQQDVRLQRRWEGAFLAFCYEHTELQPAPLLVAEDIEQPFFTRWFKKHRPDVVLGHGQHLADWMKLAGARVPETHGFVCLNAALCDDVCAAVDLQPSVIGSCGIELLVGQMLRGDSGLPVVPRNTSIPASWREGRTVRAPC